MNAIARFLSPHDVLLELDVGDKYGLFDAIGRHLEVELGLPQRQIAHCLSRREQAGSTGLGEGVAIPHARIEGLGGIKAAYARLRSPIPFGASDGRPVTDVLILLVPYPAASEHLQLLADATRLFSDKQFRARLHASADAREVVSLFRDGPEAAA